VLVLVGGVAWLTQLGGDTPPVDEQPVATTIPEEPTPELEGVTETTGPSTTVASTDTSLIASPALPPGEGPNLEFVKTNPPFGDGWTGEAVWFKGALYAVPRDSGDLFRSPDGENWELVPSFGSLGARGLDLLTDGETLLSFGLGDPGKGEQATQLDCARTGSAIQVNTSSNGEDWTSSHIELPIPGSSNSAGCFNVYMGPYSAATVGPLGIMIAALVQGEIGMESVVEVELGEEVMTSTREMSIEDGILFVTAQDGSVQTLDLDAKGYLADLEAFVGVAASDPTFSDLAINGSWGTGRGYAWFSSDGQTWTELDATGPLDGGEIFSVVATDDSFVAIATGGGSPSPPGLAQDMVWESTDGLQWIPRARADESGLTQDLSGAGLGVWNDTLVTATASGGVWSIEDDPSQLIPVDGTTSLSSMWIGPLGFFAVGREQDGGGTEVLFSSNGTEWNRYVPPEFGPAEGTIYPVGIGDDFVVVKLIAWDGTAETAESGIWVGRLP
jgi:hypothetical protein